MIACDNKTEITIALETELLVTINRCLPDTKMIFFVTTVHGYHQYLFPNL